MVNIQVTVITSIKLYMVTVSAYCVLCHVSVTVHVSVVGAGHSDVRVMVMTIGAGHEEFATCGMVLFCAIEGKASFELLWASSAEELGDFGEVIFCAGELAVAIVDMLLCIAETSDCELVIFLFWFAALDGPVEDSAITDDMAADIDIFFEAEEIIEDIVDNMEPFCA
jgi:hypothetical protein